MVNSGGYENETADFESHQCCKIGGIASQQM